MKIVPKVWGEEHWIVNNNKYCGKKLILKKGHRCSLHHHKIKEETFYLQMGKVLMEIEDKKWIMQKGDVQHIKPKELHRFTGLEDSEIMEFSTQHDDNDSYRKTQSEKIDLASLEI
tara:strand:- start:17183 stop:17530 length:348 start_codon:yes stop_codon:yes gene_type:complete